MTRTNATVRRLLGIKRTKSFPGSVKRITRMLMCSAYYRDCKQWADAEAEIEHALLRLLFNKSSYGPYRSALGDLPFREWKRGCFSLLDQLPKTDKPLNKWLAEAKKAFNQFRKEYPWECQEPLQIGRLFPNLNTNERETPVIQFMELPKNQTPFEIKTIHQAKGETHIATMLVASPRLRGNHPSDAHGWFSSVVQGNGLRPEDVRRVFVALTRPRKLVVVAIPQSAWDKVCKLLQTYGFRVHGESIC